MAQRSLEQRRQHRHLQPRLLGLYGGDVHRDAGADAVSGHIGEGRGDGDRLQAGLPAHPPGDLGPDPDRPIRVVQTQDQVAVTQSLVGDRCRQQTHQGVGDLPGTGDHLGQRLPGVHQRQQAVHGGGGHRVCRLVELGNQSVAVVGDHLPGHDRFSGDRAVGPRCGDPALPGVDVHPDRRGGGGGNAESPAYRDVGIHQRVAQRIQGVPGVRVVLRSGDGDEHRPGGVVGGATGLGRHGGDLLGGVLEVDAQNAVDGLQGPDPPEHDGHDRVVDLVAQQRREAGDQRAGVEFDGHGCFLTVW